ncbi:MAG TPA: CTP synthase (glutamine hydrolyzing) [Thermoplasmatales archaeon]|nr:CTP synthase (glutamine hydrolyzing) [Thermoplasmatales archaeon]
MPKYIVVTGGVLSGLGKGIVTSSIALLLKSRGHKITAIKIDPYLNCDAGTMNPFQHGEVFVLEDGGEVDLDLGNYERFLDINLSRDNNITTGKVYKNVIEKERRGDYLGKTVQIVPHITDEIKSWIRRVAEESDADICVVEIGGTVGDIESMPFLEAVRQLHLEEGGENVIFVHTTLVPVLKVVGEQKTKPTQHSVKELRAIGISPDIIVARSTEPLKKETKQKISLFCNVPVNAVFSSPDVECIYEVPLLLEEQGLSKYISGKLNLSYREADLDKWRNFVNRIKNASKVVNVAMVGKYTALGDSYISILEAFRHAGAELDTKVNVIWIEAEEIEEGKKIEGADAILVPGGFGERGAEGKIMAIKYARENNIPFLGICFGFQLAVVEYGRNVVGLDCHSTEIKPDTKHPVIMILPEQYGVQQLGGTMRLGAQPVIIKEGTLAHKLYGKTKIYERHRHRYEVNPEYIEILEKHGLVFSGVAEDRIRMEILELPEHPYFIASQFHPEFKSRPLKPAPLFYGFIKAAVEKKYGV